MTGTESIVPSGNEGGKSPIVEQGKKETSRTEVVNAVVKVRNLWRQREDAVYDAHKVKVNGVETRVTDYTPQEKAASAKFDAFDAAFQSLYTERDREEEDPKDPAKKIVVKVPDFKKSYTREVKDSEGNVTAKVQEGLPAQPLLDFLAEEIKAAGDDEAKVKELDDLRGVIDANNPKTYDLAHGGPNAAIRIDEAARRIAKENNRTKPDEADIKQAKTEIDTHHVITFPESPLTKAGIEPGKNPHDTITDIAQQQEQQQEQQQQLQKQLAGGAELPAKAVEATGDHKYPYYEDEPRDVGLTIDQVRNQSAEAWKAATSLITAAKSTFPNMDPNALYAQVEQRIRFSGDFEDKKDPLTVALNAVPRNEEQHKILMALEAQQAQALAKQAEELTAAHKSQLDLVRRREVRVQVGHEDPTANVQGGLQPYFEGAKGPRLTEVKDKDGNVIKVEGEYKADKNPQRDLYAFALITNRLLDIKDPSPFPFLDANKTYREQIQEQEAILKGRKGKDALTPEQQAAGRKLVEIRRQFTFMANTALLTLDEPGSEPNPILQQMKQKLNEVKSMSVAQLIEAYEDSSGRKLERDAGIRDKKDENGEAKTAEARMRNMFPENTKGMLFDYARKGGDLIRRRATLDTPSIPTPPDRIRRKIFVEAPGGDGAKGSGTTIDKPTSAPTKDDDGKKDIKDGGKHDDEGKKGTGDKDKPGSAPTKGDEGQGGVKDPGKEKLTPAPTPGEQVTIDLPKPPVAPPGEVKKPGEPEIPDKTPKGEEPPKIKIGLVNRTEAAGQLGDIRTSENINDGLRRRGWARFTNWIRRIAEVPNRFRQREGVMNILNGENRRMLGRATMEATAAAVRAELNASAAGTLDRFKNMSAEQADRRGEQVRELAQDSPLRSAIWDRMLRTMVVNGEVWDAERVRVSLRDIVNDFPRDADARAILDAPNRYGDRAQEFASDILDMAKVARERYLKTTTDKEGKPISEDDRIKALDKQIVFVLGNERAAAQENGRGWEESALYRANMRARGLRELGPIGAFVANTAFHPVTIGVATAILVRGWTGPVKMLGNLAAPLAPFTPLAVASAAAGVAAGARKWQEANRDYWTVNKDVAYNRRSSGPDARNRRELEAIHDIRNSVTAETLHAGGGADVVTGRPRRSVADIIGAVGNPDPGIDSLARHEARSRLAEIIKREEISVDIHKNLITFSGAENYGKESANLTKDENALIKALDIDTSQQNWYTQMQSDLSTEMTSWANHLTPNQETANRRMRNYRARRAITAGAISFGTGMVGGILGQKVISSARAAVDQIRTGQPQYIGPTLFDRMGKGAVEHSGGFRNTGAGQFLEQKFSVPPSIDSFKNAFSTGQDITLPNGLKVHPDNTPNAMERKLWLQDAQGTPLLDKKGNAVNIPMFVKPDGSIIIHGDISKAPDLPTEVKTMLNALPHKNVDSFVEVQMKQALVDVNAGKPAFFDMPNPVTNSVDRVQVMQGGKFWLPSTPHVMGEIQPNGTVKFTGAPGEMKPLNAALQKGGLNVSSVTEQNISSLHDRVSALIKSQPNGGEIFSDEGRIKISYDNNKIVTITDMSKPHQPSLKGHIYWDKEVNPTNVPRPGGPRGDLANFKFEKDDFAKMDLGLHENLIRAGFTGRGFFAPNVQPPAIGYNLPLEGSDIALAAPDTAVNAVMTLNIPKDMLITPPTVREPWPAIPLPFDPRRPLEGYGTPGKKAEATQPKPKASDKPIQTDTPTPAPTQEGIGEKKADGDNTPAEIKPALQDVAMPGELKTQVTEAYKGNATNHEAAILAVTKWKEQHTNASAEQKAAAEKLESEIKKIAAAQKAEADDKAKKTETHEATTPGTPEHNAQEEHDTDKHKADDHGKEEKTGMQRIKEGFKDGWNKAWARVGRGTNKAQKPASSKGEAKH